MNRQPQETEMTGSEHTPLSRNRRRLAAKTGAAMFAGAVLALGMTTPAAGADNPSLPKGEVMPLFDSCGTGYSGHYLWSQDGKTLTVTFTPSAAYKDGITDIDVRGTAKDNRNRERTVRLKDEWDPTPAGETIKTFNLSAGTAIWRISVGATDAAGVEVHALESENEPCEE